MSSDSLNKVKIIYDRLYHEYGGDWSGVGDFSKKLGVSRQGLKYRKDQQSIDYDELVTLFPDVNKNWLLSKNEEDLKTLPVKKSFTRKENENTNRVSEAMTVYEDRKASSDISDEEREILLEYLQGQAESLSKGLRRLAELNKKRS